MKIGFAQLNTTVGDLRGNFDKILASYQRLASAGAELVITPELAITGYPPQDLVFKSRFVPENLELVQQLHQRIGSTALAVGFVDRNEGRGKPFYNAVALLEKGQPIRKAYKCRLPTYDVFDEDRYFEPASKVEPVTVGKTKIGLTICEDIWTDNYLPRALYQGEPAGTLVDQGAELIVNLSASPFNLGKPAVRYQMIREVSQRHGRPILYCNAIGGNDQIIFDGNSVAFNGRGDLIGQLKGFAEEEAVIDSDRGQPISLAKSETPAELFAALTLGLRDYATKCNFKSAVLGLSGGIDSAVVAALAAHALGPENVVGVSMPSQYSSRGSVDDSKTLAKSLGIQLLHIPIAEPFAIFKAQFKEIFAGLPENETEENMQPRLRAMVLMALSNKFGHLVLSTGNKSELSVGYCTIYGDMAGGLAVISDVPKTMIYQLAHWMNREREIIPHSTIEKPPSAELKPNQKDQDTLPPYEILDEILRLYVEENLSARDIIGHGFDEKTVRWVQRRVDLNEYKREQAAPGLKVTSRAFGLGRRMPIAQKYVD